jgi:hypothetical protein
MWKSPFLLTEEEHKRFADDYDKFRRRVQNRSPDGETQQDAGRRRQRGAPKVNLPFVEELTLDELKSAKQAAKRTGRASRFLAVSVREDDGMSWSASAVDRAVAQEDPKLERIPLRGRLSAADAPEIARVIGPKKLLRLAIKHRVSKSIGPRAWVTAVLAGGFIALSAAFTVMSDMSRPLFLVSLVAIPALALLTQPVSERLKFRDLDSALEQLVEELSRKRETEAYGKFVDAVAERLAGYRLPRCVIVDGYERLDTTTKAVIRSYYRRYAKAALDYELWVVFETLGSEDFGDKARTSLDAYGHNWTRWYEQLLLDDGERQRLAEHCGRSGQADLHTVKAICGAGEGGDASYELFFDDYRRKYPASATQDGTLELFYLLALGSAWGGSPMFSEQFLHKRLRAKAGVRQEVLRVFLAGTGVGALTKDPLAETLVAMKKRCQRYLTYEPDGPSEFRVLPEVGRFLAANHGAYGLPDPRLGHLFWALLWHDLRAAVPLGGFLARKLMLHILESLSPDLLPEPRLRASAMRALFDATLFAVDRGMKLCVLERIPGLLARAQRLLESADPTPSDAKRLRNHALQAYSVLGDEQLLSVIFELEDQPEAEPTDATAAVDDPLDRLFLQTMSATGGDGDSRRSDLALAWSGSDSAVKTYGQVRAAWLALVLKPFLTDAQPSLIEAARVAGERLPGLVRSALARFQQGDLEGSLAIDVMSLSTGLWCLTTRVLEAAPMLQQTGEVVAELRRHGEDSDALAALEDHLAAGTEPLRELMKMLEQSTYEASNLQKAKIRSVSSDGLDFILDVAATELFMTVSACAALASRTYGGIADELHEDDAVGLIELAMEDGLGVPRTEVERWRGEVGFKLLGAIEHQMDGLRATCGSLGLRQLTSFIGVRRADFHVLKLKGQKQPPVVHDLVNTLAAEIKSPDFVGLLASGTVAKGAASVGESSAMLLCVGLDAALDAGFDRQFTAQLCLLAINQGSSYGINMDRFLDHLLHQGLGDRADDLFTLLERLPTDMVAEAANWLLNSVEQTDRVDLARDATEFLRALAPKIKRAPVRDMTLQRIETFELRSKLKAGETVDGDQLIDSWKERSWSGPHYAWLLYLLLAHDSGHISNKVVEEAMAVLEEYQQTRGTGQQRFRYSSYIHLATEVALLSSHAQSVQHPAWAPTPPAAGAWFAAPTDPADGDWSAAQQVGVDVLKQSIDGWESDLSIGANKQILRVLIVNDSEEEGRWRDKLVWWDVADLEQDSIERLPSLVEQGQYFLLFKHYYDVLEVWGLNADQPVDLRRAQSDLTSWRAGGQQVPPSFVQRQRRAQLNSQFLRYGHTLFSAPADQDRSLDEARAQFNQEARRSLDSLYRQITSLPTIPIEIKGILKRHQESLLNPSVPS